MTTQAPSPRAAIVLGLIFAGLGTIPILGSLGILTLTSDPSIPAWVGVCIGVVFILTGAAIVNGFAMARGRAFQYALGLGVVGLMTAIFGWIAFGSGERPFSSTLALPFLARSSAGSEIEGRVIFGVGTLMFFGIFVGLAIRTARRLRPPRRRRR